MCVCLVLFSLFAYMYVVCMCVIDYVVCVCISIYLYIYIYIYISLSLSLYIYIYIYIYILDISKPPFGLGCVVRAAETHVLQIACPLDLPLRYMYLTLCLRTVYWTFAGYRPKIIKIPASP